MIRSALFFSIVVCIAFISLKDKEHSSIGFNSEKLSQLISRPFLGVNSIVKRPQKMLSKNEILSTLNVQISKDKELQNKASLVIKEMSDIYNPHTIEWEVVVVSNFFNACVFSGGLIIIGDNLLKKLNFKDEWIAVFAHERGHLDLGHLDLNSPFKGLFSQLQEEAADQYAFEFLMKMNYDSSSLASALEKILEHSNRNEKNSLFPSFSSHPSLKIRIQNYRQKSSNRAIYDSSFED